MEELIKKVTQEVNKEIVIETIDSDDYGEVPNYGGCYDSFGKFSLRGHCEPEDAIWCRDLQDLYETGLKLGIRNTLKVIKENPQFIQE